MLEPHETTLSLQETFMLPMTRSLAVANIRTLIRGRTLTILTSTPTLSIPQTLAFLTT